MSSPGFRWCFIGTGTLGKQVAEQITASGRHEISSVCSRRYENAEAFAARFGGKAYAEPREAILAADAVYVVTPHPSHYEWTRLAIELGKPVLCEKPFTVRAEETKELFRLARERGVYIVEGMWTWFAPVARQVKSWLEQGQIGEVLRVRTRYLVNVVNYAPRLTDPQLAGGAILDSGVYPITYLYRLFGKPERVRCTGTITNGVDLCDEIDLIYPNGQTHHIDLSICDPSGVEDILITGSKGEIYVDHFHYADRAERRDPEGKPAETCEGATTMLNEFDLAAEEIRAGRKESAYIPPQATIDVMEIMDECRRQIGLVYPFERE